jgi:hypothetical protein
MTGNLGLRIGLLALVAFVSCKWDGGPTTMGDGTGCHTGRASRACPESPAAAMAKHHGAEQQAEVDRPKRQNAPCFIVMVSCEQQD